MEENKNLSKDSVKISEEVVASITGVAAAETEGVASVGGNSIASNWAELISGKKNNAKGIKITMNEDVVELEVLLTVKYGVSIPEVAANVQFNVKNSVEEMTGLKVEKVDVRVTGIKTSGEEKKNEGKKEITEEKE